MDLDCAVIPGPLFEAELVGIAPGAFCEARPGAFQGANRGTLFLDHMAELSHGSQTRLLWALEKVLERRSVYRVDSTRNEPEPADVWILAATDQDLREVIDYHRRYREAFNLHENENFVMENLYYVACSGLFLSAWSMLVYGVAPVIAKRMIQKGKYLGVVGRHTIRLEAGGCDETTDVNESFHAWPGIDTLEADARYVYIFLHGGSGYIIPRRAFPNTAASDGFIAAARRLHAAGSEAGAA